MMEFLYFPDDKSEYIPSVIMLLIFMSMAIVATIFIRRHSAKELSQWENEDPQVTEKHDHSNETESQR